MQRRSFRRLAFLSLIVCALLWPGAALAQTETYSVLIDGDPGAAPQTGCTVGALQQFVGADFRVVATVNVAVDPPVVTDLALEVCSGGIWSAASSDPFPAVVSFPAPPVPPANLVVAVESYIPLSVLPPTGMFQLGFFSGDVGAPDDVLFTTNGLPGGPDILFGVPVAEIPTLAEWSMLLLALLLLATGLVALRRRASRAGVLLGLLLISAGLGVAVAAAGHGADGNIGEWADHVPVGEDQTGDAVGTEDLHDAFAHFENNSIHFRMDATRNGPPQAVDDTATVAEDSGATTIDVMANDNDPPPADVFLIGSVTQPANGTVVITNGGADLTYQPNPNYCNTPIPPGTPDTFTYTLTPVPSTATVSVTVTCVDDPPTAVDDSATVAEDAPATTIDVRANDTDPDAGPSSITSVTQPANGTVIITNAGADLTYQPNADYCNTPPGTTLDTFTYTLTPGGDTATVTVTVTCADDPPVAVDDAATVAEDAPPTAVDVLANDTDLDGGPISVASVTQPANGTVVITGGGTGLTYQPDADYCNSPPGTTLDTFTYTLAPGGDTATVTMTVTCSDDSPVANDDAATVTEDDPATAIDVLANDTDAEGDPFTVASVTQPANGTVVITGGGTGLTYQPDADYCNSPPGTTLDTFTYDLAPGGDTATVTVTVTCVDDPPVAVDDAATVSEDSPATAVPVLANDTDVDSGPISVASVTQPANGAVAITGGGTGLTYQPNANYCNTPPGTTLDTFTYTLAPGGDTATVSMTVTCVDDPPLAVNDAATVDEDSGASAVDVLANDTDIDGGPISVDSVTQPGNGAVVITGGGTGLTYQPNADYCNNPPGSTPDTFTYTLAPGGSVATVSVTVNCLNDGPAIDLDANDDKGTGGTGFATTYTEGNPPALIEDPADATLDDVDGTTVQSLTVTLTNILDAGFETLDADISAFVGLSKTYDTTTTPGVGVLTISGAESEANYQTVLRTVTYVNTDNAPDTSAARSIQFVASDGTTSGNTAVSTVTVVAVDTPPTAVDDSATVNEDSGANAIDVLANDTDADGGPISITSVTQPANGTVVITGGGTGLTYEPDAEYCNSSGSPDTFTYTLTPGGDTATVSVTVTCVDDNPVAVDDSATVGEDSGANAIPVLANDTDPDGGPISITSVTQPVNGTVVITGGGTGLTYQPNANYCNNPPGTTLDTFTYTLTPGGDTATVTMTVTCVDDDPVAVDDAATVLEDSGASAVNVLANDTDVDGGAISITSVTQPANGTVVITGGGTGLTYAPNANYCNSPPGTTLDTFTYTLTPGGDSATVTMTVTCVDDPPVAVNDAATVLEDSGATAVPVLANDIDPDAGPISITSVTQPANGTVVITGGGTGLTYAPNANYCNNPPGSSLDTFTYTLTPASATPTATVTMTVTCVNDPPVAGADQYDYIGNTELRVDTGASGTPHALETTVSTLGALDNDSDPVENDAIAVTGIVGCGDLTPPFVCPIASVGTVTMENNGRFTFVPEAGDTGAAPTGCPAGAIDKETFQYTLTDDGDPAPASTVGTVTLCRFARVWYVDNSSGGTTGTSISPFTAITAANLSDDNSADSDLTDDLDSASEYIFVHYGSGAANGTVTLVLEQGQHLIGQFEGLSIPVSLNGNGSPTVLLAQPGATACGGQPCRPLLTIAAANNHILSDPTHATTGSAWPGTIAGFRLTAPNGANAIDITLPVGFGTAGALEIRNNVIAAGNQEAVDLNLSGTSALELSFHDNSITAGANGLDIQETGTGSLTITAFDDNVVSGNITGSGININTATFDATAGGAVQTVAGGVTTIGAPGNGVGGGGLLLANVQGDLRFGDASTAGDLDIYTDGGAGLQASGTGGGLTLHTRPTGSGGSATIEATGGPAVDISNATVDLQLAALRSHNSASTGVSLTNVGGTFSANQGSGCSNGGGGPAGTFDICNATGTDFAISGGTANVTFNGRIGDDQGQLVSIAGTTGGTKAFTGAITDGGDGDGSGVSLSGNTGATIRFTGGLVLSTGANPAFAATGGGTVLVCDENPCGASGTNGALVNTIASTTGTALNVANTTIGTGDLEFRSIASNGAASGIILNTTGSTGGLKVKGTGSAGSGGTITASTGPGINLTSTSSTSLSFMNVQNGGDDGIRGSSVNGLALTSMTISSNGNAVGERGIEMSQLTGTATMSNSTVTGSAEHNVIVSNSSGTLTSFNVTSSSFTNTNMTTGDDGFLFENNGTGAMTVSITGSTFTDNKGDHFQAATSAAATGTVNVTFSNNTLTTTAGNDPNVVGGGITFSPSGSADLTATVNGNNIQQAFDEAINFNLGTASTAAASMIATISNNTIGTAGDTDSGSESGTGISVISNGAGLTTVAVTGNQVRQYANPYGILINNKEGSTSLNATVTGNTVANPGSFAINGIRVDAGATAGDSGTLCAAVTGNTVAGSGPGADTDIRLRQRFNTTIRLPGYGGANNDTTAVNTFVAGNNAGSDVSSAHNVGGGGGGFVGGAACPTP